jgi:phage head maturation protease
MMMWENRAVPFELKGFTEADDRWDLKGYASIFNVADRVDDIVEPGAFRRTIDHHKEDGFPISARP